MTTLIAYHNDPAVKAKYTARFAAHRAADEVIQGQGFENGRGCFVGCTLDDYKHARFPIELGWPEWLAFLADRIFEGLPKSEAPQFGTDLLEAVSPGVDLEPVKNRFLVTIQRRNLTRLEGNNEPYAIQCRTTIQSVIDWLLSSDESATESARSARSATWSVAWLATESATRSAARSARSAWLATESAAESATWSAAESARSAAELARSATRSAAESAQSAAESAQSAAESAQSAAQRTESQLQRDSLLSIIRAL